MKRYSTLAGGRAVMRSRAAVAATSKILTPGLTKIKLTLAIAHARSGLIVESSSDHTVLTYSPMTAAIYHRYIRSIRGVRSTWHCGRRLRGWCNPICAIRAHLGLTSHTLMTAAPTCSHDDFTCRRVCAGVVFGRSSCFAVPVMRRALLRRRRGFAIGTWLVAGGPMVRSWSKQR